MHAPFRKLRSHNTSGFLTKITLLIVAALSLGVMVAVGVFWGILKNSKPATGINMSSHACEVNPNLAVKNITANGVALEAEVAESDGDQQRGLSGRNCIADDHALIFPYKTSGSYCFWMKEMNFPIDMIWLGETGKIVTIHDNVTPETYPQTFCPKSPSRYVVEVRAGKAKESDWDIGTQFNF